MESHDESDDSAPRVIELQDNETAGEKTTSEDDTIDVDKTEQAAKLAQNILETMNGVKILFLTGSEEDILSKKRFASMFDHVFIGTSSAHILSSSGLNDILSDSSTISVEGPT